MHPTQPCACMHTALAKYNHAALAKLSHINSANSLPEASYLSLKKVAYARLSGLNAPTSEMMLKSRARLESIHL